MPTDYWGRIIEDNDKSFEKVQDELYYQHHYHPTNIPHYNTSASEDTEQAELDAQTESLGKHGKGKHDVNGLPGPVSSEPLTGGIGGGRVDWRVALFAAVVFIGIIVLLCRASGGIQ